MDYNKLEDLLQKYWEGDTDLQQEGEIRAYLQHPDLPEKYKKEAALFRFYAFEKNTDSGIKSLDSILKDKETSGENTSTNQKFNRSPNSTYTFLKIAAVLSFIIASTYLIVDQMEGNKKPTEMVSDTFEDPKEAYEETKKVLMLLSSKFGNGRRHVEKIGFFNESKEKIQRKEINETE